MAQARSYISPVVIDIVLAFFIFAAVLAPRIVALNAFVTADEGQWLNSSLKVAQALQSRQWESTFQLPHPGATVTFLGAAAIKQIQPDMAEYEGQIPTLFSSWLEDWSAETYEVDLLALLTVARRWITVAIAFLFAVSFFPLRRLMGRPLAVFAILFATWSPMSIAFSRQLQPDGTLAALCFASLAFFLAWLLGRTGWWSLVLSGIFMGLAWLTKVPAIVLLPTGVILAALEWRPWVGRYRSLQANPHEDDSHSSPPLSLRIGIALLCLWILAAVATYFIVWPAMWSAPLSTLQSIIATMIDYSDGHTNPNFFLGHVVNDPGPFFYPVAYLFRITPATVIGLVAAAFTVRNSQTVFGRRSVSHTALGFLVFAVLDIALMTLVGKKFDRYILPAFLVLDLVAALGLIALAQVAIGKLNRCPSHDETTHASAKHAGMRSRLVMASVVVLALGPLHGLFAAQHYPYYMTYFNPLVGGNRTAPRVLFVGWGEGLEQVASWLNQQPDPDTQYVISWYALGPLSFYLDGEAVPIMNGNRLPWLDADYVVVYINQLQRNIPTEAAMRFFAQQEPVYEVVSHGMTMAQVYDMHAIVDDIFRDTHPPVELNLPDDIDWSDLDLDRFATLRQASIASVLPVEMTWSGNLGAGNKASLRLSHEDGTLVAQRDVFLDEQVTTTLFVPPDAEPGMYHLQMMLYEDESHDPIPTTDGRPIVELLQIPIALEE